MKGLGGHEPPAQTPWGVSLRHECGLLMTEKHGSSRDAVCEGPQSVLAAVGEDSGLCSCI